MGKQERWATRLGLVLAMAGNAVGLGNFLRFPAQAARNGGGAFLIPYLVALLILGLPLVWIEWTMGRFGGQRRHHSTPGIFQSMGKSRVWKYFGLLGMWSCLIISAYYLYIETWCMAYAAYSAMGGFFRETPTDFFARLTGESATSVVAVSRWGLLLLVVCISINVYILSRGLAKGIEIVAKIGMPLLILFAAILAVRGFFINPVTDVHAKMSPLVGLNFLWEPKFDSLLNPSVWLAAAGQIFFTLSLGMGSIHCYAAYLREQDDVTLNGFTTAATNEFCEVVLGGAILLPIAVAYLGLQVVQQYTGGGSGFGLGFMVFPTLFNNWGWFAPAAGFLWFGLLFVAAITSSLAMGQPIMSFLQDEFGMTRQRSALAFGAMVLTLALPVAIFTERSFNADFDYWAGTFSLVAFAFAEAVLFAWVFGMDRGWKEMMKGADFQVPRIFYYIMKYVTPVFLALILVGYMLQPQGLVQGEERGWQPYISAIFGGEPAPTWEWSSSGMVGKLLNYDIVIAPDATAEEVALLKSLRTLRNIDRLVMLGAFGFLAFLVHLAWSRKERNGGAT